MESIPIRLKRELRRGYLVVRSPKHREEVSTYNYRSTQVLGKERTISWMLTGSVVSHSLIQSK